MESPLTASLLSMEEGAGVADRKGQRQQEASDKRLGDNGQGRHGGTEKGARAQWKGPLLHGIGQPWPAPCGFLWPQGGGKTS